MAPGCFATHRTAEIRKPSEEDPARNDLLNFSDGTLLSGSSAAVLAVGAKTDNLPDGLGSPVRVYLKVVPVCPPCSQGRPQI